MGSFRVQSIKNISNVQVPVELRSGETVFLPPRAEMTNVDVANLAEIKSQVVYVENLTEVDRSTKGRRRING